MSSSAVCLRPAALRSEDGRKSAFSRSKDARSKLPPRRLPFRRDFLRLFRRFALRRARKMWAAGRDGAAARRCRRQNVRRGRVRRWRLALDGRGCCGGRRGRYRRLDRWRIGGGINIVIKIVVVARDVARLLGSLQLGAKLRDYAGLNHLATLRVNWMCDVRIK